MALRVFEVPGRASRGEKSIAIRCRNSQLFHNDVIASPFRQQWQSSGPPIESAILPTLQSDFAKYLVADDTKDLEVSRKADLCDTPWPGGSGTFPILAYHTYPGAFAPAICWYNARSKMDHTQIAYSSP